MGVVWAWSGLNSKITYLTTIVFFFLKVLLANIQVPGIDLPSHVFVHDEALSDDINPQLHEFSLGQFVLF